MLDRNQVLAALRNISRLPNVRGSERGRSIYEAGTAKGDGSGHFHLTYAAFPGGTTEEVSIELIHELEREGLIRRSYPDAPHINSWDLVQP